MAIVPGAVSRYLPWRGGLRDRRIPARESFKLDSDVGRDSDVWASPVHGGPRKWRCFRGTLVQPDPLWLHSSAALTVV